MRDKNLIIMCVITTVLNSISCILFFIRPDNVIGMVALKVLLFFGFLFVVGLISNKFIGD